MDIRISNEIALEALKSAQEAGTTKTQVAASVLKKTMDNSEQQAEQLMKMLTGLGQNFDARV